MRIALVITDADFYAGTGYAEAWERALGQEGCEVERLARVPAAWGAGSGGGDGGGGLDPSRYDLAIAHVLVEEVAAFGATVKVAAALEAAGVPLLNPLTSIVASADKLVTAAAWSAAGIPQPPVWDLDALGAEAGGTAGAAWPEPGAPMVLKPSLCDGARYIELVHDLDAARAVVAGWREDEAAGGERRGSALLQRWVREPQAVRLFATPTSVSLAYGKARAEGDLVTHGTHYPDVFEAPPAMADLAQRMVATLGGGLMGVDVLVDADGGLHALEANAPFGFDVDDPEQGRFVARAAVARAEAARASRPSSGPSPR